MKKKKKNLIKIPKSRGITVDATELEIIELATENSVAEYARKRGWYSHRYLIPGRRGSPDRIFMKQGRCFFIEFKQLNKKLRSQQIVRCMELRLKGMIACSCDNAARGEFIVNVVDEWFFNGMNSSNEMFFNLYPQLREL